MDDGENVELAAAADQTTGVEEILNRTVCICAVLISICFGAVVISDETELAVCVDSGRLAFEESCVDSGRLALEEESCVDSGRPEEESCKKVELLKNTGCDIFDEMLVRELNKSVNNCQT